MPEDGHASAGEQIWDDSDPSGLGSLKVYLPRATTVIMTLDHRL